MKYVVDASVALKWFVPEDGHLNALRLTSGALSLMAPDIVLAEVANALRRQVRMKMVTDEQASAAVKIMLRELIELTSSRDLIENAVRLSSQLDHSVYDCMYLAAAMTEDDRVLVTADMKFAAKAAAAGFGKKIAVLEAIPATGLTGFNDGLENDNG